MITTETKKITESTAGCCDIIDLTAKFIAHIQQANIRAGTATLFVSGSTRALTTLEHEPGLVQDLKKFVEKLIPSDRRYHHDDRRGDDNGFCHLRAALFGPPLTIPIVNGAPCLGTWQQVTLLDFDNKLSHFAAGVLTPALIKLSQRGCSPPLGTPFNGSTLQTARSTKNLPPTREIIVQLIGEKE